MGKEKKGGEPFNPKNPPPNQPPGQPHKSTPPHKTVPPPTKPGKQNRVTVAPSPRAMAAADAWWVKMTGHHYPWPS